MDKQRVIEYGDRIFARVMKNGRTILDFMTENVSNMSELIERLQSEMVGSRGMVMVQIRNYHQGWGARKWMMV